MFNFNECRRIIAIDKITGDRYLIGTKRIEDSYGMLKDEYKYYTFELGDVRISKEGVPTFVVLRSRQFIGDNTSMDLIFE